MEAPSSFTLDSDLATFSQRNAALLAYFSRLAYLHSSLLCDASRSHGFVEKILEDPDSDTQGWVLSSPQAIMVVFRGTESLRDWHTDSQWQLVPYSERMRERGRVHSGFCGALMTVMPMLASEVRHQMRERPRPLFLAGHSLGAALATLTAMMMHDRGQSVAGVYTFGSPRVGDLVFARRYNEALGARTFRFVNNKDGVTRVAPREIDYSHVGCPILFAECGSATQHWVPGSLTELANALNWLDHVQDHAMVRYLELIRAMPGHFAPILAEVPG